MHYAVMVAAGIAPHSIDAATTADLALGIVDEIASRVESPADQSGDPKLTPREYQIAVMCANGKQHGDVATELGISKNTVDTHLNHIYLKLGVASRPELIVYGMKHGWLDEQQEGAAA